MDCRVLRRQLVSRCMLVARMVIMIIIGLRVRLRLLLLLFGMLVSAELRGMLGRVMLLVRKEFCEQ